MNEVKHVIKKVLIVVPPLVNSDEDPDPSRPNYELLRLVSPVEPMIVAANLLERGFEVELFDLGVHIENRYENLRERLETSPPDAVVMVQSILTFITSQDWDGIQVFDLAREVLPDVVTVLTGNTATNYPAKAVSEDVCDYSLKGEMDFTVGDLMETLNAGGNVEDVAGIIYKKNDDETYVSPRYPAVDMTDLPMPAYHILDETHRVGYTENLERGKIRYPARSDKYRDIMVARSCTLRCSFCSVAHLRGPKQKYRRKPMERLIIEVEQALEQGVEEIHFFDDLFTENEKELLDFAEALVKRNLKFPWFQAQGLPLWPLTRDSLTALAETGMYRIIAPYESGNDRALQKCAGKIHSTVAHHHDVTMWSHDLGLEIIGLFVMGMPGETRREILDTVLFAEDHPEIDYSVFSIATPLVGTSLQRNVLRNGQLDDENKLNKVIKRTVALYRTDSFREYELGVIRAFDWERINFPTLERKKKYAGMVGISMEQLDELIDHSKQVFSRFYPKFEGPYSFKDLFERPDLYEDAEPVIPGSMYG
jgi:radical SAM superfamily enzyme YgiQ (UPF0313 family)